jgi:hypothetical protein
VQPAAKAASASAIHAVLIAFLPRIRVSVGLASAMVAAFAWSRKPAMLRDHEVCA